MTAEPRRLDLKNYLRQEPVILTLLTVIAILFFAAVSALARMYDAQHLSLAQEIAAHGMNDLRQQHYAPAVEDFRTALEYSRDNATYQLSLAEALMGLKRYDEAQSYLMILREREPDNGRVSLQLARIAVKQNQTQQALRFYHAAIYSTWPGNQDEARHKAQWELINYLLGIHAIPQADAELIDLQASLGAGSNEQQALGEAFARVGDDQRALAAFQRVLREDRHDADALAGAGNSAYQLGQYVDAERYLRQALARQPGDTESADLLKRTETVLHWDPFRQQIPPEERSRIVIAAFQAAGARLKTCKPPTPAQQALQDNWTKLKPQVTMRALRDNQDIVSEATSLAFAIEEQTASDCGPQTDTDRALLLVADLHKED